MEITIIDEYELNIDLNQMFLELGSLIINKLELNDDLELSVLFVGDDKIQEINRDYRDKDRPTDVISFAMNDFDDNIIGVDFSNEIGDIFISIDTAKKQAKTLEHSLEEEIIFLFVHGFLHLLGYDHMNDDDEKEMFAIQEGVIHEYHQMPHQ